VNEVFIDSTDELIRELNQLPNHYIYRGQANATWQLQSSLERVIGSAWSSEKAEKFESFSLERFKSKFHLYDRENVEPRSKLAWLSLMQHYGVPTRLVDFTESPYVALYFALETYNPLEQNNLAMYAFDYKSIMDCSISHIAEKDSAFRETRLSVHLKQDQVFEETVDRFAYDIVWVTEPAQMNARLDRQAGCFLLSGNRGIRIEQVLSGKSYEGCDLRKLVIRYDLYECVYALLRKMNITSVTVVQSEPDSLKTAQNCNFGTGAS
jgi:hypothetical protein